MIVRDHRESHWGWFFACVVVPVGLLLATLVGGVGVGAPMPLDVAAAAPLAAVVIAAIGVVAAVISRRRQPVLFAVIGLTLSLCGLLFLMWTTGTAS